MNAKHFCPTSESIDHTAYWRTAEINIQEITDARCLASMNTIEAQHCQGHFKNFPVLPVARLGGALSRLAGTHYRYLLSDPERKYIIRRAEIYANNLIFAGSTVLLESVPDTKQNEEGIIIRTKAITGEGINSAELTCWLV